MKGMGKSIENMSTPMKSPESFMNKLEANTNVDKPNALKSKEAAGNYMARLENNVKLERDATQEIKECNPNYKFGEEWKINCQRCVPTFEMRMRGADVEAQPFFESEKWKEDPPPLCREPFAVWENATVFDCKGDGRADIERHMADWGDGARAEICVQWDGVPSGHVFVAEQVDGETRYYDPQSGKLDVSWYFSKVEPGSVKVCRTDNAKVNDKIYDCCQLKLDGLNNI